MDYIKKIDKIINILTINGKADFAKRILDEKNNSFTSSELLMRVGYELNKIIETNLEIKKLIKIDVKEYLAYCKSIGLSIEYYD
jgi:hypothetical protein